MSRFTPTLQLSLPLDLPPTESLPPLLPTPTATPYGTNQGGAAGRVGPVRPSLDHMARSESILSAEVSPARISRSQAAALASTASGRGCGLSSRELLARYDPATCSWRTSQLCLDGGLAEFSETWPRSGLTASGTAYQLAPLVRLTDATESGLWPTPNRPNGGRTLHHVDYWAGTTAYHNGKKVQVDLSQAAKFWPTPKAQDSRGGSGRNVEGGPSLTDAVRLWPTPTAGDARSSGNRNLPGSNAHPGVSLTDAVVRFATPIGRDYRSGKLLHERRSPSSRPLSDQIGGALNPQWVEWLMGFPSG